MADDPLAAWFEGLCALVELLGRLALMCLQLLWLVVKGIVQMASGEE